MAAYTFSVTTGNPQTNSLTPQVDPGNPSGTISIQNDGAVALTVEGKLLNSAAYGALGTIAANTLGGINFLPGLTSLKLSATSGVAVTGIVVY